MFDYDETMQFLATVKKYLENFNKFAGTREISLAITKLDECALWLQADYLKRLEKDEIL